VKYYPWGISFNSARILTLRKIDQKYLQRFVTWCWRKMQTTSWADRVRNEEVLGRVKEERNIVHAITHMKANWIGHFLRKNYLLEHVIEV
jgi:vacuolar-type H+-ATPase catalytic subunit A/Vma1